MSHTVKIKTEFKEWKMLKAAFEAMGWRIEENSKIRNYGLGENLDKKYRYVAINPGDEHNSYDIGIDLSDNKIALFSDYYGGSVEASLGKELSKLKSQYQINKIEDEYLWQGAQVEKIYNQVNGTWDIKVTL